MELLPRLTARSIAAAVRLSGAGQASSMPGKAVNALFPGYLASHARRLGDGFVVVTGTNGKTTTANMAARALSDAGREIVHNSEGANLLSGIATAFARRPAARFALLEIDEAIVPAALSHLGTPRVVVLTNLFRDQLDRYGEVDRLAAGWRDALRRLAARESTVLVANADDPIVTAVAAGVGLADALLRGRRARRPRRARGQRRRDLPALRDHAPVHLALAVAARRLPLPLVRLRAAAARPGGARAAHGRRARGGGAGRPRGRRAPPPRARPLQRLQRPGRARPDRATRRAHERRPGLVCRLSAGLRPLEPGASRRHRRPGQPGQEPGRHEPDAARPWRRAGRQGAPLRS